MDQEQPTKTFSLPEDFVFKEILTKLPVKSLIRFKSVSKSWLARISNDTSFISAHLDHHSNRRTASKYPGNIIRALNLDEEIKILKLFLHGNDDPKLVEIDTSYMTQILRKIAPDDNFVICLIGSCNGLVCIKLAYSNGPTTLVLWNPATREFNNLPEPTIPKGVKNTHWHNRITDLCFGFDEYSEDYKVGRIEKISPKAVNNVSINREEKTLDVQIFSKKRGSWRQLEGPSGCKFQTGPSVAIDGAMHWAVLRGEAPAKGSAFRALSLDMRTEELREVDGLGCHVDDYYWYLVLIKWKGCLGGLLITVEHGCQLWLKTKNDNDNSLGWTKMFIINLSLDSWPFAGVLIRDQFIIFDAEDRKVVLYDIISQEKREFAKEFGRFFFCNVYDYVPSLVSPN